MVVARGPKKGLWWFSQVTVDGVGRNSIIHGPACNGNMSAPRRLLSASSATTAGTRYMAVTMQDVLVPCHESEHKLLEFRAASPSGDNLCSLTTSEFLVD